jgi:phosphatidylinositol alpha-mannosyltransferase
MKIGIVCPYSFDHPGGVMQHILDFSKSLIEKGHIVKVLAPGTNIKEFPNYVTLIGSTISIPVNGSFAHVKFGLKSSNDVLTWLTMNDFDVLHVHEPTNPSISLLALFHAECPVVATFHAYYKKSPITQIFGYSIKSVLKKIEVLIAVSENAKQTAMESFKINPVVIPNGINIVDFIPKKPVIRKRNTILFLGRVNEKRKGLTLLLQSLKDVKKNIPDVKLVIAGSGELSSKQISLIEKNQNNIEFLGPISEKQKHKLFLESSLYIAPQLFGESFGIVILEAFASKIPVVASAIPAFIDVCNGGKSAELFAVNDKKHLARKITYVFNNDDFANDMVNNAYKYVKQFDWKNITKKIENIYKSTLK